MGMNRTVAIALAGGLGLALVLVGGSFAAFGLGLRLDPLLVLAVAVALAVASVAAVLIYLVLNRPNAGPVYIPAKLTEDPVAQFVSPFMEKGAIEIVAQPYLPLDRMLMRHSSMFEKPEEHRECKVLLTLQKVPQKKGREEAVFNPVTLRNLFDKLKPFDKSEHVLLIDEKDQFIGYIPWQSAIKDFTGENAETKIRNAIVNVLANPQDAKSVKALRAMNGMAADDCISDTATIRDAARLMWGAVIGEKPLEEPPVNGLVLYHGKKITKLVGVLTKKSLLQLVATGA
jgi:hypothetical protein